MEKVKWIFVFDLYQTDPLSPLFDEENNRKNVATLQSNQNR